MRLRLRLRLQWLHRVSVRPPQLFDAALYLSRLPCPHPLLASCPNTRARTPGPVLRYRHLAWRLDVEVARRTVAHDAAPSFRLRLDTAHPAGGENAKSVHLVADCASLKHVQAQLEAAVREEQSVHAKRFQRYIQ